MYSRFLRVLLWLVLWCFCCGAVTAQGSPNLSLMSEPLWESLLASTSSLPSLIRDYRDNWIRQVDSLLTSNADLRSSNDSLTQQNEGLQTSLRASQKEVATSKAELLRLQKSLADSTQSTIQAQAETRRVKVAAFLKGMFAGAVVGTALIVTVGRLAN